jgi:citrate lyase subunit beta/citryl-CoA lyase
LLDERSVHAHSSLFVPADRPERYAKALASGADAVITDLEDAVGSEAKRAARDVLLQSFTELHPDERSRVLV